MGVIGTRVLRVEDGPLLRGEARFTDDLQLEGAAHVHVVGSPAAHALIGGIDVAAAAAAPGVLGVYTAADLGDELGHFPFDQRGFPEAMARPWLATDRVRYVGEPVAVVVAETAAQAADAADLVEVGLEPLPAVVGATAALAEGAPLLHPEAGTNACFALRRRGEVDLDACEVVVRHEAESTRLAPSPLEARAAQARWAGDRLELWATTQGPFPWRDALVALYGLAPEQVRVVSPAVGGGFGSKEALYPEVLLLPWLARRVGRPVRWAESRTESMLNLGHGRAQAQRVALGGRRDGTLVAYDVSVDQDAGAYPRLGAVLPFLTGLVLTGPYRIPTARFEATAAVTNTTPVLAYRGAGQPEAVSALEVAIDAFAAEVGLDPAEVRRRNLLGADEFPHTAPLGATYDGSHPLEAFERALELVDYEGARAEQASRRPAGRPPAPVQLGIGLAAFMEVTGGPEPQEHARVRVGADGRATVHAGSFSHGQGHRTGWAMVVADRLGIPVEDVDVVDGDTDVVPHGSNTGGSRSVQTAGNAIAEAAGRVADQARLLAAELLEASPDDVRLDEAAGAFHVAGVPAVARSWRDVAALAEQRGEPLVADAVAGPAPRSVFASGAQAAVVEVDVETGAVALRRMVAVADCGRVLNPLLAEGQLHGGVAQGAAQALCEVVRYDADGTPRTTNFADYGIISAAELPAITTGFVDRPAEVGLLGAKGLGEGGTIGAAAAVQNAVVDALRHLGVRHVALPCAGEAVWRAVRDAAEGPAADA